MEKKIRDALEIAQSKVEKLMAERAELDKEIERWKGVVDSLSLVSGGRKDELPADVNLGDHVGSALNLSFTDGVRTILQLMLPPMTAPQIRQRLEDLGFNFSKYKQRLVPLHNTLRRLVAQGEVEIVKEGRQTKYQWINQVRRALEQHSALGRKLSSRAPLETATQLHASPTDKKR